MAQARRRTKGALGKTAVALLTPSVMRLISHTVEALIRFAPPLQSEDALGLAVIVLRPEFQRQLLAKNKRLDSKELVSLELCAVECVLITCKRFAQDAGILPRIAVTEETRAKCIMVWWARWRALLAEACEIAHRNEWNVPKTTRQGLIFHVWRRANEFATAPPEALLKDIKEGLVMAKRRPLEASEARTENLAATFYEVNDRDGKGVNVAIVDRDGTVRIGKSQLRDALRPTRRKGGAEIPLPEDDQEESSEDSGTAPSPKAQKSSGTQTVLEDPREMAPEDAVLVADLVRRLRQELKARRALGRGGLAAKAVLDNMEALLLGKLTSKELAKRVGVSEAAISQVLTANRAELRRKLGDNFPRKPDST